MRNTIHVKPLTTEAFAPFGEAVILSSENATAADDTFSFWSDVAHYAIRGETEIGYCTVYKQSANVVDWMERHDQTPEFIVPIDTSFILPVMSVGGDVEAFHVEVGQAVVIGDGVWHSACKPVGAEAATYFVVFRRGTPHDDVVKKNIDPVTVAHDEHG